MAIEDSRCGVYIPDFSIEDIPTRSKAELSYNLRWLTHQQYHYKIAYINETKEERIAEYELAASYIKPISLYLKQFDRKPKAA